MSLNDQLRAKKLDFKLSNSQEICHELGLRLKTQRLLKNLKQQDLADRAGTSVGTIKNLESKGQSSLETWIRVLIALDLVQELESLFIPKIQSIAQMEQIERLTLQRIPRRAR